MQVTDTLDDIRLGNRTLKIFLRLWSYKLRVVQLLGRCQVFQWELFHLRFDKDQWPAPWQQIRFAKKKKNYLHVPSVGWFAKDWLDLHADVMRFERLAVEVAPILISGDSGGYSPGEDQAEQGADEN